MTINEAIEIKSREGEELFDTDPDEIDEADRLSLEALKLIKVGRSHPGSSWIVLLPGETKD